MKDFEREAKDLGKEAFENGLNRVPAHNKKLMDFMKDHRGDVLSCLKAWSNGWDMANLSHDW